MKIVKEWDNIAIITIAQTKKSGEGRPTTT
jgi:hypothetical protein